MVPSMIEEITYVVLEHLRKIPDIQELMQSDIHDLELRLSSVERHTGEIQVQMAGVNSRMDRVDERIAEGSSVASILWTLRLRHSKGR
jgi:hypothetical protein